MRAGPLAASSKFGTAQYLYLGYDGRAPEGARARRPNWELHCSSYSPHSNLGTVGRGELDTAVAATTKTFHNIVQYRTGVPPVLFELEAPQPPGPVRSTEKGKGPSNCARRCQLHFLFLPLASLFNSTRLLTPYCRLHGYQHVYQGRCKDTTIAGGRERQGRDCPRRQQGWQQEANCRQDTKSKERV